MLFGQGRTEILPTIGLDDLGLSVRLEARTQRGDGRVVREFFELQNLEVQLPCEFFTVRAPGLEHGKAY